MGKFYLNKIFSNSTEIDFMTSLLDFILSIDPRITCDTTVAEQYDSTAWEEETSHIPTFNFSINGKITITAKREANLANYALAFNLWYGTTQTGALYFSTAWHQGGINQNLYREYNISALTTDSFILFSFAGNGSYLTAGIDCVWFTSDDKNYINVTFGRSAFNIPTIFNISGKLFTEMETLISGTFVSKFPYRTSAGNFDYSRGAAYINNSYEVFRSSAFIDCTEVTVGDTIALTNGAYFAVGPHQLLKIIDN